MSQNNVHVKGRLIRILGVGAVGALAALLLAPKSGKELRKDIKKKTNGYYDETKKFIGASKIKAKDLVNGGLTLFASAKNKTGKAHSTGKEVVDGETGKLKAAVKSGAKTFKKAKQ